MEESGPHRGTLRRGGRIIPDVSQFPVQQHPKYRSLRQRAYAQADVENNPQNKQLADEQIAKSIRQSVTNEVEMKKVRKCCGEMVKLLTFLAFLWFIVFPIVDRWG